MVILVIISQSYNSHCDKNDQPLPTSFLYRSHLSVQNRLYMNKRIIEATNFGSNWVRPEDLPYQTLTLSWDTTQLTTTGLRNATKRQKRLRSSTSAALTACFSVSSSRWRRSVTSCSEVSTRRCSSPLFPLLAFFCNRSVSVDRFFSSALALLYSVTIIK